MKKVLLILLFCIFHSWNGKAQADFYSLQPLGDRYIYDSEYFDDSRELQVYRSGVDAMLKSDSLLTIYVFALNIRLLSICFVPPLNYCIRVFPV